MVNKHKKRILLLLLLQGICVAMEAPTPPPSPVEWTSGSTDTTSSDASETWSEIIDALEQYTFEQKFTTLDRAISDTSKTQELYESTDETDILIPSWLFKNDRQ